MQKNIRFIFASCAAMAVLLAGCAVGHTHQSSGVWEADLDNHWTTCAECGKTLDTGAHTLDGSEQCTVCGAQVIDWGDNKSVYRFNEYGDFLSAVDYDANGEVVIETVYEYEYDADGNLLHSSMTVDGVLSEETVYTTVNGECLPSEYTLYMEDGSKTVNYYDENGNAIQTALYTAEGNVDLQTESEYALSSDGQWYETVCTITEADGSSYISEFAENGDQTSRTRYDADGNFDFKESWERTYNADGNWETMKYYLNDVLTAETIYATAATEDGSITYPQTVTDYGENGEKIVTVYDENDNVLSETHYDANGKVVE